VVFWCDLAREPVKRSPDLLVGREAIALKNPDAEKDEPQPEQYRILLASEEAERAAESKRLWYVAATRARDRLVVAGLSAAGMKPGCPGGALLQQLGPAELSDGAELAYEGQGGQQCRAQVRLVVATPDAGEPRDAEESTQPAEHAPFVPAPVPAFLAPLTAAAGRARHSATELMVWARCTRRHWFKYVAGLREPEVRRSGEGFMSAVARGQIVHDVLEHLAAEEEFDTLLEAAIGRWDAAAPPPETPSGQQYRGALAREIAAIKGDAAYRALDERPGRRHELGFLQILGPDALIEGKIDLAAPEVDGFALLDVKTGGTDAEALSRKAEGYALQRDVYVSALEGVSGSPVRSFAFHFSGAGRQVGGPLSDQQRRAAADAVRRAVDSMGTEPPALTRFPDECRFCGYKRVGWCEGAPSPA
jgi:ATP-dependent helicase/nuclease subunit A